MKRLLLTLASVGLVFADGPLFQGSSFQADADGLPAGWRLWAPRAEIAPRLFIDALHSTGGPGSLAVSGASNPAVCGGWERVVPGIEGGKWYRFSGQYRAEGLDYEPRQVVPRLDWLGADGKRAGQPEYGYRSEIAGAWTRVTMEAPAPETADAVRIQLLLWQAPNATVWWDDISLTAIPEVSPRPVRIAAVNLRPRNTGSAAASVEQFIAAIDKNVARNPDIVLLPEGITVVGTGLSYADVAEAVPGPTTRKLAEVARRHGAWVAAGIYEREANVVYNTAVLLDRSGKLAGKYRKVHIPREETEGGLTPGSSYPVFETDFGKVGMMICWDVQYADPARALALAGAEIILMPIWGGNEVLAKARAIENHVFLAASGYDYPTHIIDPAGEILAVAAEQGTVASATVDLNRRYVDPWLGYMRGRFMKEVRLDIPVEPRRVLR